MSDTNPLVNRFPWTGTVKVSGVTGSATGIASITGGTIYNTDITYGTIANVPIINSSVDGTPIGTIDPDTGVFTVLTVQGASTFGSGSANCFTLAGAATANAPRIDVAGPDTNADGIIVAKGTGRIRMGRLRSNVVALTTSGGVMPVVFESLTNSITGTVTSGLTAPNLFTVGADTANATGALGGTIYYAQFSNIFGGSTMTGGRVGINVSHSFSGGNSGNGASSPYFHIGVSSQTVASSRDGGTPTAQGGKLFAFFGSSELRAGGKYWEEVKAAELNVAADLNSSVTRKVGITVVMSATDAEEAITEEMFLGIGAKKANATNSTGMRTGIMYGGTAGYWGIPSYGALIEAAPTTVSGGSPPPMSAAYGIDWSLVEFFGAFIRSANFAVDGAGNLGGAVTAGTTLQTRSAVLAKTAVLGSVTVLDGGTFSAIPLLTVAAPPDSGTTATVAVDTMGVRGIREILSGGTGYTALDVLTLVGGTSTVVGQILVTEVSGGVITAAKLHTVGSYTVLPTTPVAVTGGTGTGATFGIGWQILTVSVSGAGTNYPEFPAPAITSATTSLIRRPKFLGVMTPTQVQLQINDGKINVTGIPTSAAGLSAGDVWSNGGVLTVV